MPAKPMKFADLRKSIGKGTLGPSQLRRIFVVDEVRSRAFAPFVRLNPEAVDTKGLQLSQAEISDLLDKARGPRRRMAVTSGPGGAKVTVAKAATGPRLLAEGDSWFDLPNGIYPADAMDYLGKDYRLLNLAKWGAELSDIVSKPQYLVPLRSGNFRHFFLSGGGNDVLASIAKYVKPSGSAASATDLIKPEFDEMLKGVMKLYARTAAEVKVLANTTLYVHGYANAIPVKGRKYLGKPLSALGYNPASALARAIVAEMVGRFNQALRNFAATNSRVIYIDLRAEVGTDDWHTDEIHPNANGARKIARRFNRAIIDNTPVG